ncbi:MAG: hypothetical protein QGF62_00940 [Gammaproteobacteria bacterium]|nr:hypothetical protein [Gammaproteobacteria bacterium]
MWIGSADLDSNHHSSLSTSSTLSPAFNSASMAALSALILSSVAINRGSSRIESRIGLSSN